MLPFICINIVHVLGVVRGDVDARNEKLTEKSYVKIDGAVDKHY